MVSSHDFVDDKRNKNIKIYINGKFYKRKDAKISVFDSSTMLGDGIWDSLRYHNDNFRKSRNFQKRIRRYGFLVETGGCAMKKYCPTLSLVFDFEGLNEVKHPKN